MGVEAWLITAGACPLLVLLEAFGVSWEGVRGSPRPCHSHACLLLWYGGVGGGGGDASEFVPTCESVASSSSAPPSTSVLKIGLYCLSEASCRAVRPSAIFACTITPCETDRRGEGDRDRHEGTSSGRQESVEV